LKRTSSYSFIFQLHDEDVIYQKQKRKKKENQQK